MNSLIGNNMEEKTKEDLIIEKGKSLLEMIDTDMIPHNEFAGEYEKLLNNYTKLNKQFARMMKLGDSSLKSSRVKNQKTISIARTKIISSYKEQRNLKKQLLLGNPADKKKINNLAKLLNIAMIKIDFLEAKVKK